jgi:hypothetical protein
MPNGDHDDPLQTGSGSKCNIMAASTDGKDQVRKATYSNANHLCGRRRVAVCR